MCGATAVVYTGLSFTQAATLQDATVKLSFQHLRRKCRNCDGKHMNWSEENTLFLPPKKSPFRKNMIVQSAVYTVILGCAMLEPIYGICSSKMYFRIFVTKVTIKNE